jgi:hypothetical protein
MKTHLHLLRTCFLILHLVSLGILEGRSQPQYATNFFTTVSPSSIPYASNTNNKVQWLYLSTDLAAAPSGNITRIYFRRNFSMLPVINSYTNLVIKMGQTTMSSLPPGPWITNGMVTVFQANTYDFIPVPGDWMPVTLQTPFSYDNNKNFIVEVTHGGYTVGFDVMQASMTARSLFGGAGSVMANSQNVLCDFGIDHGAGAADAGLEGYISIDDTMCSGMQPVAAVLRNNGPGSLTSVTLNWKVNNVLLAPVNWSGSLAVNATTNVNLGSYYFLYGTPATLVAWTSNPNNQPDPNTSNDTITHWVAQVNHYPTITPYGLNYTGCLGDTLQLLFDLTGAPPWLITYSDGLSSHQVTITASPFHLGVSPPSNTTYQIVSCYDANGCHTNINPVVQVSMYSKPVVSLGPDITVGLSQTFTLNAGSASLTYQWSTGATGNILILNGAQLGPGHHVVSVTATATSGCSSNDSMLVTVIDDTGLKKTIEQATVKIYPNPADQLLMIEWPDGKCDALYEIISSDGKHIKTHKMVCTGTSTMSSIYIGDLPEGLYLVRVTNGDTTSISKIIRHHQ